MRGSDRIRTYCVYPEGTVLQTVVAPPSSTALPIMWTWAGSNHRRKDLQSFALPTELQVHRAKALLSWRVPPIEAHLIRPIPTRISYLLLNNRYFTGPIIEVLLLIQFSSRLVKDLTSNYIY